MFAKIYEIINGYYLFIYKTELKLEYDAKTLANEIVKEICLLFGHNEESEFQKMVQEFIDKAKSVIQYVVANDYLFYLIKKINLFRLFFSKFYFIYNTIRLCCYY